MRLGKATFDLEYFRPHVVCVFLQLVVTFVVLQGLVKGSQGLFKQLGIPCSVAQRHQSRPKVALGVSPFAVGLCQFLQRAAVGIHSLVEACGVVL